MSSLSSVSSDSGLYQLFQKFRSAAAGSQQGGSGFSFGGSIPQPSAQQTQQFDSALKAQGFSDKDITSLQGKIQSAVSSAVQSAGSGSNPFSQIQSAIQKTLKDNGVNLDQLKQQLGGGGDVSATGSLLNVAA